MHEFINDKLDLILDSIKQIEFYTKDILNPDDFKKIENDLSKLDATMMRLQAIGENIKKINKTDPDFFSEIVLFDTNIIIRFRDFISHHYEKLDVDIVFDICQNDIPLLKQKIQTLLSNNNESV